MCHNSLLRIYIHPFSASTLGLSELQTRSLRSTQSGSFGCHPENIPVTVSNRETVNVADREASQPAYRATFIERFYTTLIKILPY